MALELLSVDFSSTVIGSALSVVVVIISYVVYRIGIGEKSFEEVIEEQKKRSIEEELLKKEQKSEKGKKEKKFKKTWGKKSKERTESEMLLEPIQIAETKNLDTDIEIIEPKEVKSMKQKNKSKSASTQHSFDVAVQEKVKVDSSPIREKYVAEKKVTSDVEKIDTEPRIEDPKEVQIKEAVQPPPVISTLTLTPPASVSHKKKKKEHVEKDSSPMTASKIISIVKGNELEAEEIQNLIDALLNKQKDNSGWTKKNDTLAITKKNLHEKEQMLDQELRQNQVVTSKLKELREDYNALKTKLTAQEKSSSEKVSRLQQDIQSLTTKTKQMQDQLATERKKISQIEIENEMKVQIAVKNLEEEKSNLEQKISKLETESRSGISKTEFEAAKKAREELQKVHTLLVEQHTQLVSREKNQHAQLSDLNIQIEKVNSQNRMLADECKDMKDAMVNINLAKRTIEDKLMAEKKRASELEIQVKQLSSQATDIMQLQSEISKLKSENERLTDQLVTTKERVAGDGQEVLHQNGEMNGKNEEIPGKIFDEKDKLLEEKEFLLAELNDDLTKQKTKVALLGEEIEVQKQKNNELREKNWKAMEALTNAEKNAELKLKELQLAADQKYAQLEKDFRCQIQHSESEASSDSSDKLKKAEDEAAQNILNYTKELEKNKQLSNEIFKLNDLHRSRIDELQKSSEELMSDIEKHQLETKECLHRICPSISVNSSLVFEKWLLEFEKQAVEVIHNVELSSNFKEQFEQKEKEYLQKLTHCEQVLQETESTLLQLQKSAESQEVVWQERLKAKELELEQLQEKLQHLLTSVKVIESEKSHIELKYDEVNNNCLNLRDQLENKDKQILELQKQSNSLDNLNKEIEELKLKLEKEKKINKDFSTQMIRLNSLVKIGQDALTAEQEMVKKLKAQLEIAQDASDKK